MSYRFPKECILRSKKQFSELFNLGKRVENSFFIIYKRNNYLDHPRIAIVVNRRYGNAVKRNKIKRKIREFFRINKNETKNEDFIIIPKRKKEIEVIKLKEFLKHD